MGLATKIVGQKFGKITVLEPSMITTKSGEKACHVLCRCECGVEKVMSPYALVSGRIVTCGRCRGIAATIVGRQFGRLTVTGETAVTNSAGYSEKMVVCRCECGTVKNFRPHLLVYGASTSCGCLRKILAVKNWESRKCSCGETDPAKFYKYMRTVCRACHQKKHARYKSENSAKLKAGQKDHYLRNSARVRLKTISYYRANKDEVLRKRKLSYLRRRPQLLCQRRAQYDPQAAKEWRDGWIAKNREKVRLYKKQDHGRRKAAKLGGVREKVNYADILKRDGSKCHICSKRVARKDLSFDHLIPLSRGGSHTATNIAVAHLLCNLKRGPGRIPAQLLLVG